MQPIGDILLLISGSGLPSVLLTHMMMACGACGRRPASTLDRGAGADPGAVQGPVGHACWAWSTGPAGSIGSGPGAATPRCSGPAPWPGR